jgi:hypothetical protein
MSAGVAAVKSLSIYIRYQRASHLGGKDGSQRVKKSRSEMQSPDTSHFEGRRSVKPILGYMCVYSRMHWI